MSAAAMVAARLNRNSKCMKASSNDLTLPRF
jgi:hypothetical protein